MTTNENWNEEILKGLPKEHHPTLNTFKVETLEETAERLLQQEAFELGIKLGAEWQQERSYSEEEVIAFGEFIFKNTLLAHAKGVKNLFEQFKNK
jgi:hypothetical protein